MSRGRPKNYFEPWVSTRSTTWEREYQHGPPKVTDESDWRQHQAILDWQAAKFKAEATAEQIVWGSKMGHPSICVNLSGSVAVMDDRRILGVVKSLAWPEKTVTHKEVADRIVASVNACAGISDPEQFVKDVRALMLSYCKGECEDPRTDNRVIGILARCIPPEEMAEFHQEESDE